MVGDANRFDSTAEPTRPVAPVRMMWTMMEAEDLAVQSANLYFATERAKIYLIMRGLEYCTVFRIGCR